MSAAPGVALQRFEEALVRVVEGSWMSLALLAHAAPPEPLTLAHQAAEAATETALLLERELTPGPISAARARSGALAGVLPELDRQYLLRAGITALTEGVGLRLAGAPEQDASTRAPAPWSAAWLREGALRARLGRAVLAFAASLDAAGARHAVARYLLDAAGSQRPSPEADPWSRAALVARGAAHLREVPDPELAALLAGAAPPA